MLCSQVEKDKFRSSVDKSVQVTNGKVQGKVEPSLEHFFNVHYHNAGALESVGVTDTRLVFQVGAVGIASLVGLVLARKKSMAHGIAYPALTGGTVWGTIYFSSPKNRRKLVESVRNMTNTK